MYIEAAELSERHADIKFQYPLQLEGLQESNTSEIDLEVSRKGNYILKDC